MGKEVTAKKIRASLISNLRFDKQIYVIATEVGSYYADVLCVRDQKLVEYEIKISRADLIKDFQKLKHKIYKNAQSDFIPTQFYFVVPENLIKIAIDLVKGSEYAKYGVIECSACSGLNGTCWVRKRAKNIHNQKVSDGVINTIAARASSQLANLLNKEVRNE